MRKLLPVLPLICLSACGGDPRTQVITLDSDPPGAACVIDRADRQVGHLDQVAQTPSSLLISGSRDALRITCAMAGFPATQMTQPPTSGRSYPPSITVSLRSGAAPAAPGKPLSIVPNADAGKTAVAVTALPPVGAAQK